MSGIVDRRAILIASDVIAAFVAVLVALWLRFGDALSTTWLSLGLPPLWVLAAAFAGLTFASFGAAGVYRREMYWDFRSESKDLAKGLILLGFTSLAFLFLFKLQDVSRVAILISFAVLALAGISSRLVVRWLGRRLAARGSVLRNWLVVGSGERLAQVVGLLESHPHVGAGIVGVVADAAPHHGELQWLGSLHDLPEILTKHVIDEVVVSGESDQKRLEAILSVCAAQGKTVRLSMDSVAPTALIGRMEEYGGIPMWSVLATPEHRLELALKRLIDVAGAVLGLVFMFPILVFTSLAILLVDGRPVLYKQRRGGYQGREFTMFKFRTMVDGAETLRESLLDRNERAGPFFKIADDPRITSFGKFLRKTSLDETPQLLNVLFGQMSLVGPRPQPVEEVAEYDLWHRRRLSVRPGITGLWQVRARKDPSFDVWMDHDLEYIDRWSLWLDLWILIQTPRAMISSPGE